MQHISTRYFTCVASGLLFGGALAATPLQAQTTDQPVSQPIAQSSSQAISQPGNQDYLTALKKCQNIADNTQRLACYDNIIGGFVKASDEGDVQLVNREDVTKTRRRLFGFSMPDLGIFGSGKERKKEDRELKVLESTVTGVRYTRKDSLSFTIEEGGAVWQISNAPSRLRRVKPGDKVEFEKAALGSYWISINGQMGVKGRRVR